MEKVEFNKIYLSKHCLFQCQERLQTKSFVESIDLIKKVLSNCRYNPYLKNRIAFLSEEYEVVLKGTEHLEEKKAIIITTALALEGFTTYQIRQKRWGEFGFKNFSQIPMFFAGKKV